MAVNYQLFIDELRLLIITQVAVTEEDIKSKAETYAQLCEQANQRLKRCYFFLLKQNHSEMERLAFLEPNLFDFINALLIPELEEWRQMVRPFGLKEPEDIIIDYFQAIEEACKEYQTQKPLYERLRFYSLIGAPVLYRLGVMCQISALEPNNQLLKQDIDAMDTYYFSVLEEKGKAVLREGDFKKMEDFYQILNQRPLWSTSSLAHRFSREIEIRENEKVVSQLSEIEKELQEALEASDEHGVKACLARWDSLVDSRPSLNLPSNLHLALQQAKEWIAFITEQRDNAMLYQQLTNEFLQEIDHCSSKKELKQLNDEYRQKVRVLKLSVSPEFDQYVKEKSKSFTAKFIAKSLFYISIGLVAALAVAYFVTKYLKQVM